MLKKILRKMRKVINSLKCYIKEKIFRSTIETGSSKDSPRQKVYKPILYHFVLGSNNFLFKEEPLEEILRERTQHFRRTKKPIDFWVVESPQFLAADQFKEMRSLLDNDKSYSAVVSTNPLFITWLKLRLHNVGKGTFLSPTKEIPMALFSQK
uniref:hypothetical protein n=1 Tax=Ascoseira mirabilis TaxID=76830 RepID=UPI00300392EC|nr:hypothetical protein ASMI105 [Ascoseira mirabilis]